MNCKPGDTAFIVRNVSNDSCMARIIGRPVTVDRIYMHTRLGAAWQLRTPFRCASCGVLFDAMFDADLQPIRGQKPGESVTTTEDKPEEVTA